MEAVFCDLFPYPVRRSILTSVVTALAQPPPDVGGVAAFAALTRREVLIDLAEEVDRLHLEAHMLIAYELDSLGVATT